MSRIPDEIIDQIRDAADIVGIIGEGVDLKRTGSDFRGPCPFHGGQHRNFAVVPKKQLFHCFVCHEKGDVFTYLMKRFGMDYPTAVREIGRRVGIAVPERAERTGPDPHEHLRSALAAAHDWFAAQLRERPDAAAARTYLADREIPAEVSALHGLGWAPAGNDFFTAMGKLGVSDRTLLEAGLAVEREGGRLAPRFQKRLLFPIHDTRGRVVAFGGRLLGDGQPKYLNSPETPVYHKGGLLYHVHEARHAIRKAGYALVVEGYFDVLRLVMAGLDQCVAPLGTALTDEQAALLSRYTDTVLLLYDSDQAGLKATFRAGDVLLAHKLRAKVVTMPEGEDPDTLVRAGGAAAIEPLIADAVDVLERKIQLLERRGWLDGVDHRREALDRLLPTIRAAADPIMRELYLSRVAERTGVSRDVLEAEVKHTPAWQGGDEGARGQGPPPEDGPRDAGRGRAVGAIPRRAPSTEGKFEGDFLRLLLEHADWRARARGEVPAERFEHPVARALYQAIVTFEEPFELDRLADGLTPEVRSGLAKLLDRPVPVGDVDRLYTEYAERLEARPLVRAYEEAQARARSTGDAGDMDAAQALKKELATRFPSELDRRSWTRARTTRRRPPAPDR